MSEEAVLKSSHDGREGPETRWVIYEDEAVGRLLPLTWLRPASEFLLGAWTGRQRLERVVGRPVLQVCRDHLAALGEGRLTWSQSCPVSGCGNGLGEPWDQHSAASLWDGGTVWVSAGVIADKRLAEYLESLRPDSVAVCGGQMIAFRPGSGMVSWIRDLAADVDAGFPAGLPAAGWPEVEVEARVLRGLADLVRFQEGLLADDLTGLLADLPAPGSAGDGQAYRLDAVRLGEGCVVDHGAVLDAREGPVVLGSRCHVFPHTWLRGPLYAGDDCLFLGGRTGTGTSLGPVCRVRGEIEASVMLGYCNKAHDGFIGHSYLGEWINLGAMTTTSDLKNNYSAFRLAPYGRIVETGLTKVGAFLADHVKTRIGCLIGGGTVVGVGANIVGDPAVTTRWIPDFAWGTGSSAEEYDLDRFLDTARIVYGRRDVPWTEAVEGALRAVHEATREARRTR